MWLAVPATSIARVSEKFLKNNFWEPSNFFCDTLLKMTNAFMLKKRQIIFFSCWFFFLGIAIAYFLPRSFLLFDVYFFAAALALFSAAFLIIFFNNNPEQRRGVAGALFIACLWLGFLFLGIARLAISLPSDSPYKIWHYNGEKTEFIAVAASEPVRTSAKQKIRLETVYLEKEKKEVAGAVLVSAPLWPKYSAGDILKINCELQRPGMIDDFDYGEYLAARDIYSLCSFPQIEILKDYPAAGKRLAIARRSALAWQPILRVREYFRRLMERGLPEPEAGIFKAFLLGDQGTVPEDINNYFRQSGLSHIVAISGTHITLLCGILLWLFLAAGLNRRQAFYASLPVLLFYVFLAGAPPSAVRAGFMGFLVLLAFYVGRLNRLDYSLVLAAAAMLLINPKLLMADAGFELSFAAVLGMIYCYPFLNRKFGGEKDNLWPPFKFVINLLALTLAAQALTLPILIWRFGQVSFVAPLANLLAVWTAPFIMAAGLGALALSAIFPFFALWFWLPAGLMLKYLVAVAAWTAQLPLAYLKW